MSFVTEEIEILFEQRTFLRDNSPSANHLTSRLHISYNCVASLNTIFIPGYNSEAHRVDRNYITLHYRLIALASLIMPK